MEKAFRLFMATLTMLWSTVVFAGVEGRTWGAVKGLYRGEAGPAKGTGPATAADWILFPINPWYPLDGLSFGAVISRGTHLGDDCVRPAGTPVYAVWGGFVRYVRYHSGTGNWGWLAIVENQFNNIPFCAVYGHLSGTNLVAQGTWVPTGGRIGQLGSRSENGNHTPHLHLGIHFGYYNAPTGTYPSWCRGYGSSTDGWLNPSSFIARF